jgi:hypothetical protein
MAIAGYSLFPRSSIVFPVHQMIHPASRLTGATLARQNPTRTDERSQSLSRRYAELRFAHHGNIAPNQRRRSCDVKEMVDGSNAGSRRIFKADLRGYEISLVDLASSSPRRNVHGQREHESPLRWRGDGEAAEYASRREFKLAAPELLCIGRLAQQLATRPDTLAVR